MKKFFTFLILCSLYSFSAYADEDFLTSNPAQQSIKTIRENIEVLEEKKQEVEEAWTVKKTELGDVQKYIRTDLSPEEILTIKNLLEIYRKDIQEAEESNSEKVSQKKQVLYKKLLELNLIEENQKEDYLMHVKITLSNEKEAEEIEEKIEENKEKLEQKVETIKEKIEENNKTLESTIKKTLEKRIDTKIQEIISHEKYIILPAEKKVALFDGTLEKVLVRKAREQNKTEIDPRKMLVLEMLEEKIRMVIEDLRK